MATPRADSYTAASGAAVYAGRFSFSDSLTVFALSDTGYVIGWSAVAGATSYQYRINGGAWADTDSSVSTTITGRTAGSTDTVQVRAIGASGVLPWQTSKSVTLFVAGKTTVSRTIGISGYYATAQEWNDDAPANLITSNVVWEGLLLNQAHTGPSLTPALIMNGSTADAGHYKHLTAAPGASFADHVNRRTNPLRYNNAVGAAILVGTTVAIELYENFGKISRLQVKSAGNQTTGWGQYAIHSSVSNGNPLYIDRCILESGTDNFVLSLNYGPHVTTNCVVIATLPDSASSITPSRIGEMNRGSLVYNTLFVAVGRRYPLATAAGTNDCYFKNCGFFGVDAIQGATESPGPVYENCFSDATNRPTGVSFLTFDEAIGSGFENKTIGTHDLRLKSTSALIGAGATDALITTDLTDRIRTGLPDVGPWEYQS